MKELFNIFQHFLLKRDGYEGHVAGYTEDMFILAVETKDTGKFFREKFMSTTVILPEYRDPKYRYVYANESEILKQQKDADLQTNKREA